MSNEEKIQAFINADKYELYEAWSPGDCTNEADKKRVNEFLNACAEELLACSNEETVDAKSLNILNRYAVEVADLMLDTEDSEFTQEVLMQLASVVGIRDVYAIQNPVTSFLDSFMGIPVDETLVRQCMECGNEFSIEIQSRLAIVPPFWLITRCNACKELDYIELPEGILQMSIMGCNWIEAFEKTLHDREDVLARLNDLQKQGVLLKGRTTFRYLK